MELLSDAEEVEPVLLTTVVVEDVASAWDLFRIVMTSFNPSANAL